MPSVYIIVRRFVNDLYFGILLLFVIIYTKEIVRIEIPFCFSIYVPTFVFI